MGDVSLINVGALAKPATVLIEKISSAVGTVFEPTRIRREADAVAYSRKTLALADVEITDLQRRAMERLVQQEGRKQKNIESITAQAIDALPDGATPEALQEDWIAHFFKQCETVSDQEMQSLWARLLAGEASSPGQFSKRTVDAVATLDKEDAEMFVRVAQFVWNFAQPIPLIYNLEDSIYKENGITFNLVSHLAAIGLITFQPSSNYTINWSGGLTITSYHDWILLLEPTASGSRVANAGQCILTKVGIELYKICGASKCQGFAEYAVENWVSQGFTVYSPLRNRI